MAEFLKSLSKNALALLVIAGAIVLIVASDPPVTKCSHQVDSFKSSMVGELVKDPKQKFQQQSRFDKLLELCQRVNSPGGCYELFTLIRSILEKSKTISLECMSDWGSDSLVKGYFQKSLKLMVELPWTSQSGMRPLTWYEGPQMQLFCQLQDGYKLAYGETAWAQERERIFTGLPGYKDLGRQKAWGQSVLSVSCSSYRSGVY